MAMSQTSERAFESYVETLLHVGTQFTEEELIEDLMIERMAENDGIVARYMADEDFQRSALPILAKEIFDTIWASLGA
jgi:hypothetical protein